MSAALVTFAKLGLEDAAPGEEECFGFKCPKGRGRCEGLLLRGRGHDVPQRTWMWSGSRANPTFAPSINCQGCWHGFIENGRCVDTNHQDEPEPA